MADKNAHYAIKMLHHLGFLTRTDVTSKFVGWDKIGDIGRCDVFAARSGKAVSVEIKQGSTGFDFSDWREPQRKWAKWSSQTPFNVPYWIYLTLGKHPAHYNTTSYMPKRSWLIPQEFWLASIDVVTPIQKSIPYQVKKGMRKEIQELGLDAQFVFAPYALKWHKDNSLTKPSWSMFVDQDDDSTIASTSKRPKTKKVVSQKSTYGGFWLPDTSHPFFTEFCL